MHTVIILPVLTLQSTTVSFTNQSSLSGRRGKVKLCRNHQESREQASDKCLQVHKYQTKQNLPFHPQCGNREALLICKVAALSWQYTGVLHPRKCSAERCLLVDAWHAAGFGIVILGHGHAEGSLSVSVIVSAPWQQLARFSPHSQVF